MARAELARFSEADANNLPEFEALIEELGNAVRFIAGEVPPNLGGGFGDIWKLLRPVAMLRKLRDSISNRFGGADDHVRWRFFSTDGLRVIQSRASLALKALLVICRPCAQGSAYVLLHHAFGQVSRHRCLGLCERWYGAISDSMANACRAHGGEM